MRISNLIVRGLLSFGSDGIDLPISNLNVLIGPNGAGKSNLIEIINLLKYSCNEISFPMKALGGVREWFWKGKQDSISAMIEVQLAEPGREASLTHRFTLGMDGISLTVKKEEISYTQSDWAIYSFPTDQAEYEYFVGFPEKHKHANALMVTEDGTLPLTVDPSNSVLSQIRDASGRYTELTNFQQTYEAIRLFRTWHFGPSAPVRSERPATLRNDFLSDDGENLSLVISKIKLKIKPQLRLALRELFDGIQDVDVVVENGAAHLYIEENGKSTPSSRLSDGTLRYLCLLAILLHPDPPGLIVIEEPELGLHPDVLPYLGKLIKHASNRMQLVITTHSQILLDAFSESPEDVIICSKIEGQSRFERLSQDRLDKWLEDHTLGELWNMGELGGTRW